MAMPELPLNISPNPPPQVTGTRAGIEYQTHRGKKRDNDNTQTLQYPEGALRYEEHA